MLYNGGHLLCSRHFFDLISNIVTCGDNETCVDLEFYFVNSNLHAYDLIPDLSVGNVYI